MAQIVEKAMRKLDQELAKAKVEIQTAQDQAQKAIQERDEAQAKLSAMEEVVK